MGYAETAEIRLSGLLKISLQQTRGQVRESTLKETRTAMEKFIRVIGDINCSRVGHQHGEMLLQACLDEGQSRATANKILRHLKRLFQLTVYRGLLEKNPLQHVKQLKVPKRPVHTFSPDECQCAFRLFSGGKFTTFASENNLRWPEATLFNQQGRRDTQNQVVVVWPDGRATYFERFTATLQAPDFNFRMFPFDTQEFFIRIDSLFPEEFYLFEDLEGFSEIGEQLGFTQNNGKRPRYNETWETCPDSPADRTD